MLGLIGCLMFTERTSGTLSLRQLAVKVTEMDFRGVRVSGGEGEGGGGEGGGSF